MKFDNGLVLPLGREYHLASVVMHWRRQYPMHRRRFAIYGSQRPMLKFTAACSADAVFSLDDGLLSFCSRAYAIWNYKIYLICRSPHALKPLKRPKANRCLPDARRNFIYNHEIKLLKCLEFRSLEASLMSSIHRRIIKINAYRHGNYR